MQLQGECAKSMQTSTKVRMEPKFQAVQAVAQLAGLWSMVGLET